MSSSAAGTTPYYFIPPPSRHPVMASFGLLCVIFGGAQWINGAGWGMYLTVFGLLWPDFKAVWPTVAPGTTASPAGIIEPFQTMTPFWLPTINTALLLSSGVTLTIAHHALRDRRVQRELLGRAAHLPGA